MPKSKVTLSFDLEVVVEEREDYFVASTSPFAITVYGDTAEKAEHRALKAVDLLLSKYSDNTEILGTYLNHLRVKHVLYTDEEREYRPTIVRECKQEMRRQVEAGV